MKELRNRIRVLATGVVEWSDPETGVLVDRERLSWRDRWALFGVHAGNWSWVRRWGQLRCGCTVNPLTCRPVWILWGCPEHNPFSAALNDEGIDRHDHER